MFSPAFLVAEYIRVLLQRWSGKDRGQKRKQALDKDVCLEGATGDDL
jgi:hypothetical protein